MITIGLVVMSVTAILVILTFLVTFSKSTIRQFAVGVSVLVLIGLTAFSGWLYFFFDGGTPWGRETAQTKMISWINRKYGADAYYQIIAPSRYDFTLNAYTLDVRFKSNPSLGYTFEIPDSSGQVKIYDTYSYSKST